MNPIFKSIAASLVTASILGIFYKLDELAKNQACISERLARIETIVTPPSHHLSQQ